MRSLTLVMLIMMAVAGCAAPKESAAVTDTKTTVTSPYATTPAAENTEQQKEDDPAEEENTTITPPAEATQKTPPIPKTEVVVVNDWTTRYATTTFGEEHEKYRLTGTLKNLGPDNATDITVEVRLMDRNGDLYDIEEMKWTSVPVGIGETIHFMFDVEAEPNTIGSHEIKVIATPTFKPAASSFVVFEDLLFKKESFMSAVKGYARNTGDTPISDLYLHTAVLDADGKVYYVGFSNVGYLESGARDSFSSDVVPRGEGRFHAEAYVKATCLFC